MGAHEAEWPPPSAGTTLLACWAVDLLVSWVVTETLTAPCGHILLLCQRLLRRPLPRGRPDPHPLKEAFVGPMRVASAPRTVLQPFAHGASPPLVVGTVALPAGTRVWSVVELRHLLQPPQSQS